MKLLVSLFVTGVVIVGGAFVILSLGFLDTASGGEIEVLDDPRSDEYLVVFTCAGFGDSIVLETTTSAQQAHDLAEEYGERDDLNRLCGLQGLPEVNP